jgi:hypothetical protein
MRFPRVWFTVRRMMVAVATTAVFCGGYVGLAEILRWYFFYHRAQL